MKDTRQSEDVLSRLEVYIPVEAEVKSIPLRSLPASVLRRMGLRLPASDAGRKPANSPEGIWICPALIRRKGVRTGSGVMENMSSVLGTEYRAASGTLRMSFVSSNRAATKVLKETVPGTRPSPPAPPPHSPAPLASQDAVVIYNGHIYLAIRKPGRSRVPLPDAPSTGPPETPRQPDAPSTGPPETPRQPDALSTGPPETPRQPDAPPTGPPASHSSKRQPKEEDERPRKKHAARRTIQSAEDTGGRPVSEGAALQPAEEEEQEEGGQTRRRSVASTSQQTCVFEDLHREEKIARMKARLKQTESALNDRTSSQ